jgi:prepilin-type N-terminal cleavage/methylation domain-containing protein
MTRAKTQAGFSLIEVLVAVAITVFILSITLAAFTEGMRINQAVRQVSEMDANLRAGMNMMIRDLIQTGAGIPTGGVPIPTGGPFVPVRRPGPGGEFDWAGGTTVWPAVGTGPSMGPVLGGIPTDLITVLYADNSLPMPATVSDGADAPPLGDGDDLDVIAGDGASVRLDQATVFSGTAGLRVGDVMMLENGLGRTLRVITDIDDANRTLFFAGGDALNLNQGSPDAGAAGSIIQIQNTDGNGVPNGTYPPTTLTRIMMVTYYLEDAAANRAQLMRRVGARPAMPMAQVLENMQLTYDLADGTINPASVNLEDTATPNQIRKVNLFMGARSNQRYTDTREFFRHELRTQISLRSLAYVDRYQ